MFWRYGKRAGSVPRYVPALGFAWLTPLYDPVLRWTTRERRFKSELLDQAAVASGHRVLDLGCGTGTLAIWLKRNQPLARVSGLDVDSDILARARRKASESGLAVPFVRGLSHELPYADRSFDRVLSTLFFHHLPRADKLRTLVEIHRVLRPGGELHLVDWGTPSGRRARLLFYSIQLLDGFETTQLHVRGELVQLMRSAGFGTLSEPGKLDTVYGTLRFHLARKARA
ncbi:MAG: class I SAM-dependent methyltransferase [Myxococcota bacterium]